MTPFHGRKAELQMLRDLLTRKAASLVVIKGRRRIGKSRLVQEFGNSIADCKKFFFSGMAPIKGLTAQMEREDFAQQLQREMGIPGLEKTTDWGTLFWHMANQTKTGRILIVFDEISWMGSKDPTFLPKLKTAWDTYFKNNPELIMVLSGSISSWIEKNIIRSTGFLGRISLDLTLRELTLPECNLFWHPNHKRISSREKFKILAVTGGVPRYLEEIHPEWTSEENIKRLCFQKESILFKEFDRIFNDLFVKSGKNYKSILNKLTQQKSNVSEICEYLKIKKGGSISQYLNNLVLNEYVAQDFTWNLKTGHETKISQYRLKDNYLRFYLKYIEPIKRKIERGNEIEFGNWDSIMGLQFENLVLNNRQWLFKRLRINPKDIINDNPYLQRKTQKHLGCQIDYMIQTRFNVLFLCEIKFLNDKIGSKIIPEVQRKIDRLARGKNFSVQSALIHVNGVSESVIRSRFFSHIIDFGEFLHN